MKAEIVALSEISYVKGFRARLLYKAGLRTPADVAAADLDLICNILSAGAVTVYRAPNNQTYILIEMIRKRETNILILSIESTKINVTARKQRKRHHASHLEDNSSH